MKVFKYLIAIATMVMCCAFTACNDDSEDSTDFASAVKGVYTGKLTVDNYVVEDAYVVYVSKISSTVVTVQADFYEDGSENYNVLSVNGQYVFQSETASNIHITVTGKNMNINFLNGAGTITNFTGVRD